MNIFFPKLLVTGHLFLAFPILALSQEPFSTHFRSSQSGDWNNAANWQTSTDGDSWYPASGYPDHNARSILVRAGHTIKITSDVSARRLTIDAAAVLDQVSDEGGKTISIYDDGTDEGDFKIFGTFHLYGRQPVFDHNVTATVYKGGSVTVSRNEGPRESEKFAESQQVHFLHGSTFEWNTSDKFKLNGTIFSTAAHADSVAIFRISRMVETAASGADAYINGLFEVNAPTTLIGTGKKFFRNGIIGTSELIQINKDHGGFYIRNEGGNAILGGQSLKIDLKRRMYAVGNVSVPEKANVRISGANLRTDSTGLPLYIHGTLDMTDQNITNANGKVVISETGTYRTTHDGGFSGTGSSIPGGLTELEPGSTVELYTNGDQNFKSRNDFSNLIFSGSGFKTPSSAFLYHGTITIQDDAIFNAKNYTIGNSEESHLRMTGGRYIASKSGPSPTIEGNYLLEDGTIEFAGNNQTIKNKVYKHVVVSGNVGNSTGNIVLAKDGSFTVAENGVFTINTNSIRSTHEVNNAKVIVERGGTFKTQNNMGFHGHNSEFSGGYSSIHQEIAQIVLEPGSTIEYSRSSAQAGGGNQVISNAAGLTYQNLILSGSGNKIAPEGVLKIHGDFIQKESAIFQHNNGTVVFAGGGRLETEADPMAQTVQAPKARFYDLENASGTDLKIDADILIENRLRLHANTKLFVGTGDITISSDSHQTARIEPIPSSASIFYEPDGGRFIIERFIDAHAKAWQLLAVPAFGGSIQESYQNNQQHTPGKGTNITGPFDDWKDRGFDRHSPAPSMKYFVPETNLFSGISYTHNSISKFPAYFVFVRGDRSATGAGSDARMAVTLHVRGKLYSPHPESQPPVATILPRSWGLVGNPYASSIAYHKLEKSTHLSGDYYIWDPTLTQSEYSAYGLGGYRNITYIDEMDGYSAVPAGGRYSATHTPAIQSGQAFFVYNLSHSQTGTIQFSEATKSAESANVFKAASPAISQTGKIRTNLFVDHQGEQILLDGTLHLFNDRFNDTLLHPSSKKIMNSGENFGIASSSYPLIVKRSSYPTESDTCYFDMWNMAKRNYSLEISVENPDNTGHDVFFNDAFLNRSTLLSSPVSRIHFSVDDNSNVSNRFFLTFRKRAPSFSFGECSVTQQNTDAVISWNTKHQMAVGSFVIEHAHEHNPFSSIGQQPANTRDSARYTSVHLQPPAGWNHYRVKAMLKDGRIVHSDIASILLSGGDQSISVYPNPVTDHLFLELETTGRYAIRLIDAKGRIVLSKRIVQGIRRQRHQISVGQIAQGWYQLQIIKPGRQRFIQNVLVEQ